MTGWMLGALGSAKGPFARRLGLSALVLLLLPLSLAVDATVLIFRRVQLIRDLRVEHVVCPLGHRVPIQDGNWICASCKSVFVGSGLAPCPVCGHRNVTLRCHCQLTIRVPGRR